MIQFFGLWTTPRSYHLLLQCNLYRGQRLLALDHSIFFCTAAGDVGVLPCSTLYGCRGPLNVNWVDSAPQSSLGGSCDSVLGKELSPQLHAAALESMLMESQSSSSVVACSGANLFRELHCRMLQKCLPRMGALCDLGLDFLDHLVDFSSIRHWRGSTDFITVPL